MNFVNNMTYPNSFSVTLDSNGLNWDYGATESDDIISSVYFDESSGVTVVIWNDNTKTIVRTCEGDSFDKERGVLQAYFEKMYGGTKTQANKYLKKIIAESTSKKDKEALKAKKKMKQAIHSSEDSINAKKIEEEPAEEDCSASLEMLLKELTELSKM